MWGWCCWARGTAGGLERGLWSLRRLATGKVGEGALGLGQCTVLGDASCVAVGRGICWRQVGLPRSCGEQGGTASAQNPAGGAGIARHSAGRRGLTTVVGFSAASWAEGAKMEVQPQWLRVQAQLGLQDPLFALRRGCDSACSTDSSCEGWAQSQ